MKSVCKRLLQIHQRREKGRNVTEVDMNKSKAAALLGAEQSTKKAKACRANAKRPRPAARNPSRFWARVVDHTGDRETGYGIKTRETARAWVTDDGRRFSKATLHEFGGNGYLLKQPERI